MAFPLPRGLTPSETTFLCEMEMVTVVPRQRLEGLDLLEGPTEPLLPPRRCMLPLWLALLLKRQHRVNVVPPPWLNPEVLASILDLETTQTEEFTPPPTLQTFSQDATTRRGGQRRGRPAEYRFTIDGQKYIPSPPFLLQNVSDMSSNTEPIPTLPYHWLEIANMLLDVASDDLMEGDQIRRCIRDIREVRMSKMRQLMEGVDATAVGGGDGLVLSGVGAMEVGEARGFISGAAETLRQIGASKEEALREQAEEGDDGMGYRGTGDYDDDMEL